MSHLVTIKALLMSLLITNRLCQALPRRLPRHLLSRFSPIISSQQMLDGVVKLLCSQFLHRCHAQQEGNMGRKEDTLKVLKTKVIFPLNLYLKPQLIQLYSNMYYFVPLMYQYVKKKNLTRQGRQLLQPLFAQLSLLLCDGNS